MNNWYFNKEKRLAFQQVPESAKGGSKKSWIGNFLDSLKTSGERERSEQADKRATFSAKVASSLESAPAVAPVAAPATTSAQPASAEAPAAPVAQAAAPAQSQASTETSTEPATAPAAAEVSASVPSAAPAPAEGQQAAEVQKPKLTDKVSLGDKYKEGIELLEGFSIQDLTLAQENITDAGDILFKGNKNPFVKPLTDWFSKTENAQASSSLYQIVNQSFSDVGAEAITKPLMIAAFANSMKEDLAKQFKDGGQFKHIRKFDKFMKGTVKLKYGFSFENGESNLTVAMDPLGLEAEYDAIRQAEDAKVTQAEKDQKAAEDTKATSEKLDQDIDTIERNKFGRLFVSLFGRDKVKDMLSSSNPLIKVVLGFFGVAAYEGAYTDTKETIGSFSPDTAKMLEGYEQQVRKIFPKPEEIPVSGLLDRIGKGTGGQYTIPVGEKKTGNTEVMLNEPYIASGNNNSYVKVDLTQGGELIIPRGADFSVSSSEKVAPPNGLKRDDKSMTFFRKGVYLVRQLPKDAVFTGGAVISLVAANTPGIEPAKDAVAAEAGKTAEGEKQLKPEMR